MLLGTDARALDAAAWSEDGALVTRIGLVHDATDPPQRETVAALSRHAPSDVDVRMVVDGREDDLRAVLTLDAERMEEAVPGAPPRIALWSRAWPEALDFHALMGLVAGSLSPLDGEGRERDFRTYGNLPGFDAAPRYWQCLKP